MIKSAIIGCHFYLGLAEQDAIHWPSDGELIARYELAELNSDSGGQTR